MSEDNGDIGARLNPDEPGNESDINVPLNPDEPQDKKITKDLASYDEKFKNISSETNTNDNMDVEENTEYFKPVMNDKFKYNINLNYIIDRPYEIIDTDTISYDLSKKILEDGNTSPEKISEYDDFISKQTIEMMSNLTKDIEKLKGTETKNKLEELLKKIKSKDITFGNFAAESAELLFKNEDDDKKKEDFFNGKVYRYTSFRDEPKKKIDEDESEQDLYEDDEDPPPPYTDAKEDNDNIEIASNDLFKKVKLPKNLPNWESDITYDSEGLEIRRDCDCPSCRKAKLDNKWRNKELTPIMSYDRTYFPEPNRNSSRMSRIIWAYPKYTEELSVVEFQKYLDSLKQELDDKMEDMETDIEKEKEIKTNNTEQNNMTDDDDDELLCPISLEPLDESNIAMTCYGQYYDINTIRSWMMEHDTDPIAGRFLYTKSLITKGINLKNIKESQKKIQQNMLILSNYPHELIYPDDKIKEVAATQQYIRQFEGQMREDWTQYCIDKLSYFRNPDAYKYTIPTNQYLNNNDELNRPEGTGKDFEYIDLSGDYFNKFQHIGQVFKGASFNGADLSNNVFVQCAFNRCTFIGTNIASSVFHGCSFLGEEVNFADASTSDETQFIDCSAENIGDWTKWTDPQMIKLCFKNRFLKGAYSVISLGSFDD